MRTDTAKKNRLYPQGRGLASEESKAVLAMLLGMCPYVFLLHMLWR